MEKATVPDSTVVAKWVDNQKQRIKDDFGNDIEDEDLDSAIQCHYDTGT